MNPSKLAVHALAFDDMNILDVTGPMQSFSAANRHCAGTPFALDYFSMTGRPVRSSCGLVVTPDRAHQQLDGNGILLIPGGMGVDAAAKDPELISLVQTWADRNVGNEVYSICSGALILASAGILDGKHATSHWSREAELKQRFPKVNWQFDLIFTKNDTIKCSAGVTSGIDLALEIISGLLGKETARRVAKDLVVYRRRTGGQRQFGDTRKNEASTDDRIGQLIDQVTANPAYAWSCAEMAASVGVSERTLMRQFREQLETSPAKFVDQIRTERAKELIQSGMPLKLVAGLSGFGDIQRLRRSFKKNLGVTLAAYQAHFSEA